MLNKITSNSDTAYQAEDEFSRSVNFCAADLNHVA